MSKPIAVFTTSEIQGYSKSGEIIFTDDQGHHIRKGARLQAAIDQGFEVYLVTTRTTPHDFDGWWMELVPGDHFFAARESDPEQEDAGGLRDPAVNKPWRDLYKALGLEWPADEMVDGFPIPTYWTRARERLELYGITLGNKF